jgi:single-strand DNA-binding protein
MVNKVILIGNVGQDVTTRDVSNGIVANTSLATSEKRNGEEKTEWHRLVFFGKLADLAKQYLTKGSKVTVAGDFATREHEDKTYLTIRVDQVTLGGGGQERGQDRGDDRGYQAPDKNAPPSRGSAMDDEIPFAPSVL